MKSLTYKWRSLFPLAVVLLSLLSLAVLPILVQRRIGDLRSDINDVAEPARDLVTEIQLALALGASGTRGFLLTGRQEYATASREARTRRWRAYSQLLPLARRLGPQVTAEVAALAQSIRPIDALLEALLSGRIPTDLYLKHLDDQQTAFQVAVAATGRLDQAIAREEAARRREIRAIERLGAVLTVLLVVLALVAALVVEWLGREYRALAIRLDMRAREQTALREIAHALGAAVSVQEVVQTIAERTVATRRVSGAYVERIESPGPAGEVEVIAASGVGAPPVGTRAPFPGSLSERVIESGEPEIIKAGEANGERFAPYLPDDCRSCSGLIVPVPSDYAVLGSLVLLRGPQQEPFKREEAAYAEVLGDLASAALRRVLLLESERIARKQVTTILESITDAFYAVDAEWRFTYVNSEAERLLQRPRAQLLGRILWKEFPGIAGTRFEREYRRAFAEQRAVHFEACHRPLDIWVNVQAYPSPDGLSVYFLDVTARKEAEERLRQNERIFRTLGNSIPQLAWMADATGHTQWYNDRWYEYTGSTEEQMLGFGWQTLVHPEHVVQARERFRHSIETGEPWEDTYPLRSRTGEYRWFLSLALPIRNPDGAVVRWFGTNTDITERIEAAAERERLLEREREARAEAERQRNELQRVTESRASLMRGFSHDVKNPLGAVDGYLQLLEEQIMGDLTGRQKEGIGKARRSLHAALGLIDDLLDLARAEAGEVHIEPAPADLRNLARDVAEEHRAQAEAKGLDLIVHVPEELPVVTSDVRRIRQVLGNLLSNAVKYTERGSVTVNVMIRAGEMAPGPGRWVTIGVADTGPGLSTEQQRVVFREFRRLETAGAEKGKGIGLAISRIIARALGGDISVESEVGRGSVFTLWLPLQ